MSGTEIKVLTTVEQLESLGAEWRSLGEQRWGPLVSHAWFTAAARAFHKDSTLHVVTVWREGSLAAVAPMAHTRHRGLPCLEIIGQAALYEPTCLVSKDHAALADLSAAIISQRLPTVIQRLDADDPCLELLAKAAAGRGQVRILPRPATCFVDAREYSSRLASRDLRRKRRRLAEQGFHTTVVKPTPPDIPQLLAEFFEIESSGWKGRRGSSLLARPDLQRFVSELAERFADQGAIVISFLRRPERGIAAQFCMDDGRRLFAVKIGYDEAWRKYSPGVLLSADTIEFAVKARSSGYEFLGLAEDWQELWATGTRAHCAAVFYPSTMTGVTTRLADSALDGARRLLAVLWGRTS